ncbi:MAG: hypothetical protein FWE67_09225 [Planctomycetaceae bacterium]|nr:hypothetical protein [Planctomycetaceae bacterium]
MKQIGLYLGGVAATLLIVGGVFFGLRHGQEQEQMVENPPEMQSTVDAGKIDTDKVETTAVSENIPEKKPEPIVVKPTVEKPVAEKPVVVKLALAENDIIPPVKKTKVTETIAESKPESTETPAPTVGTVISELEKPADGVNTTSPVNTVSPVNTASPVRQDSPVKQDSPVRSTPVSFIRQLVSAAVLSALLNQTMESAENAKESEEAKEAESVKEAENASPPMETNKEEPKETESVSTPVQSAETKQEIKTEAKPEDKAETNDLSKSEMEGEEKPQVYTRRNTGGLSPAARNDTPVSRVDLPASLKGENVRFNFRGAAWRDVIEWFAEQAGLSLQADLTPQGTLNLTDTKAYTPSEAIDILNSYLLFKEFTLLRKGKSLFVIYLPDGIPPNLLEPITPEELDDRGKYELCRCVFNLSRTMPDIIQAEAEKLLGPQGSIVQLPKSQQIIVTETGGTLRTIRDIIKRIDDPDDVASGKIQIIEPKNLSADEALSIMRKLLSINENDASLRTATDISGTRIWMSGRGDMIERAKEIIQTLDESYNAGNPAMEGQPQFEVHNPGTADPAAVLAVLQTLLVGIPDIRLSLDPKTNGIAALARPANHITIRETIKQMQVNRPVTEVIPLKRLSPSSAVDSIKKFFATGSIDSTVSTSGSRNQVQTGVPAPTVEADIVGRQILVRGTEAQIADIKAFLLKLGEDGAGSRVAGREMIRTIPLSPATAALVLDQLKEVWPKLEQNEIKVVVPSAIVPSKSTSDLLKVPAQPGNEPQRAIPVIEPIKKDNVDDLIEKTFEVNPPQSDLPRVSFRTVQYTEQKEQTVEPQYQPIQAGGNSVEKKNPPVVVSSGPSGLMISSDDPEALDKLEELIRMLSDETVIGKTKLTVYYLTNATAEVVAQTLQTLMGTSSTTGGGVSGTGTTDTSPSFDGEQRAALLAMLSPGNSIEKTGTVSISADARLNALLIQANAVDHKTIEMLLPILDQENVPAGEIKRQPVPRMIQLRNIRAEEAQASVEKIYADRLRTSGTSTTGGQGGNTGGGQRGGGNRFGGPGGGAAPQPQMMVMPGGQGGPMGMMQQMMSQMGRGGQSSTVREQESKMTLGTDARSNSLIVSAPESLFIEVKAFVEELDNYAVQSETIVEVVQLKEVSPSLAQQIITNNAGDSVKFSTTSMGMGNRGFGGSGFSGFGGTGGFGSNRFGGGGFGNTGFGGTGGFGGSSNPFMNMMRGSGAGGGMQGGMSPFGGGTRPGGFGNTGFGGGGARPGGTGGGFAPRGGR